MLDIPVIRWGQPYESLEKDQVVHFETGETLATVHQANGGLVKMDMKKAKRARDVLRQIPIDDLIEMCKKAADHYLNGTLPLGNGTQSPEEFCRMQSATTGLPEHMCASNMKKNSFVLTHMREILDALTRGLPLDILSKGYGFEDRGVTVSYQANAPVLGMVLPSNSPGVHTLWMPVIPLQIGLVLKPGPQEPWTPYRMYEAFAQAGVPREAISIYPGGPEVGAAVLADCERAMIFGGIPTVERYHGNPRVQVHGPGFSKFIFGDDKVDEWEKHVDLMADSVVINSGRSCISCSGIWASRHGAEIADAIAKKIASVAPLPMNDPKAPLAAFTVPGVAKAINDQIEEKLKIPGVTEVTAKYRDGSRLVEHERCDYLRPTVLHCTDPDHPLANTEYMFPFVTVVDCPEKKMLSSIGTTLVCSAITENPDLSQQLLDATNIDRLNIGVVRTIALNWMQPHEGNIIDFLFRARAFQNSPPPAH
ncbi:MAG: aldehyde dehydrogenase family protein [Planctomycetota bacterium]|nr:aldehyde dehydrogenase family protein [Planctomycetota bacterium]MDA1213054.1 aldehyde dehydrogenase family protein [Planctomycetota bacterium]